MKQPQHPSTTIAFVAALALIAPTAAPSRSRARCAPCGGYARRAAAPRLLLGFNSWVARRNLTLQGSSGLPIRRYFVYWSSAEQTPGRWDWKQPDAEYRATLAAGLRPLVVTVGSPCWSHPSTTCADSLYTAPPDPAFDGAWGGFIKRLVARYPAALGLEVWNEPNLVQFFAPRVDPIRYAQILDVAYATAKHARPRLPVISGGLATSPATNANGAGEGDAPFLRTLLAAGGRMDAIGVHPYPIRLDANGRAVRWDPMAMEEMLTRIRAVRDATGSHGPLWITEVGESTTTESGYPRPVSAAQQAVDLLAMIRAVRADRDIPVMLFHTVQDGRTPPVAEAFTATLNGVLESLLGSGPLAVDTDRILTVLLEQYGFTVGVDQGFGAFTSNGMAKPAAGILAAFGSPPAPTPHRCSQTRRRCRRVRVR